MFWTALGDAFPIAVAIGLSPLAIITTVVLLLAERGRSKAALFALGWMALIVAVTLVALVVVDAVDEPGTETTENGVDILQIVLGLGFWALAWASWRSRPEPGAENRQAAMLDKVGRIGLLGAFGMGLVQAVLVVKNVPLAVAGGARLGEADLAAGHTAIALVVFGVVASAGMIALVVVAAVGGERFEEQIRAIRQWLETNMTVLTIVVLTLVGAVFLGNGIAVLG